MNTSHTPYDQPFDLVIGLGRSGLSMARFLHDQGRRVVGTDIDPGKTDAAKELARLGIETHIGFHDQDCFNAADRLIPSPGIPLTIEPIKTAMGKGVEVKSELDLFYAKNRLPVIAITGTNGKTTTTSLLGQLLSACGLKPFVCGNIGTPLVELFSADEPFDIVVAEISSFQIDISTAFRPDIGVLLNISEDHLDRYDSFSAYQTSKWRLFENQTAGDTAVFNSAIDNIDSFLTDLKAKTLTFCSTDTMGLECQAAVRNTTIDICTDTIDTTVDTAQLKGLPGIHNHENAAAALLAGMAAGADLSCMTKALADFTPLPHRIEFVSQIDGINFYNDSKATNTDAVARAIQTFNANIILILGGREKSTDFIQLKKSIKSGVKTIVALGETREKIKDLLGDICPVDLAATMTEAVRKAFDNADSGDTVLLSPACASFDLYENYVERGEDFIHCVHQLKGEPV